jgi:hypothetical protein
MNFVWNWKKKPPIVSSEAAESIQTLQRANKP